MTECPNLDALAAIGAALDWDVARGLRHLETCSDCQARIDALQATRVALTETEALDESTVGRISAALSQEARRERGHAHTTLRWAGAIEILLAGLTAPLLLISSGIEIGSLAAGMLTAALAAGLLIYGRRLRLYAA